MDLVVQRLVEAIERDRDELAVTRSALGKLGRYLVARHIADRDRKPAKVSCPSEDEGRGCVLENGHPGRCDFGVRP